MQLDLARRFGWEGRSDRASRGESIFNDALKACDSHFRTARIFSALIAILYLSPSIYMMQVYDRVLASSNEFTLLMLTAMTLGLYALMSLLELVRSSVLIRVGNQMDMQLNNRTFTAAFERNLRRTGGNAAQAIHDLTSVRQFLTAKVCLPFLMRRGHRSI